MSDEATASEPEAPKRLFIPSLVVLIFAISLSSGILSLFLPEIAATFLGSADRASVGIAGQTSTVNSVAEIILAFLMSALVIRFKHKSLLVVGALLVIFSNVGSFLAPDFFTFQVFFAIEGAGSAVVAILAITLIGDSLIPSKKATAVSWYVAGVYMAAVIGMPVLLLVANVVGWRSVFVLFTLPVSVTGLILACVAIPSESHKKQMKIDNDIYAKSFKQVLLNKSASSCLIGSILGSAAIVALFVLSFYRQQFLVSRNWAVGIGLVNAALFMVGSLVGGRLINRFGPKTVAVTCGFISAILTMIFFNMPILWLTLVFNFASVIIGGFSIPAFICLIVDQAPKSRGTMMSLNRIAGHVGAAIGAAVGGTLLALFSYQALGLGFGAFLIAQSAIFFFLVKQPTEV